MTQITEDTFEQLFQVFNKPSPIDLREAAFIDPYGMVGMLEIGELLKTSGIHKTLYLPESEELSNTLKGWTSLGLLRNIFNLSNPPHPL